MMGALSFLLISGSINRTLLRIKRLRRPKYLVSALAGVLYLYFVFISHPFFPKSDLPRAPVRPEVDYGMLETVFALLLLAILIYPWIFRRARTFLFTGSEIQFLFPAPVSRRALIHYRLLKAQPGIVLGIAISFLILDQGSLFPHTSFLLAALWIVYTFLSTYKVLILLVQADLDRRGSSPRRRQAVALGIMLLCVCAVSLWAGFFTPPHRLTGSGPVYYLLLPLRLLIRPAFASGWISFAARFIPAFLILGVAFLFASCKGAKCRDAALMDAATLPDKIPSGGARRSGKPVKLLRLTFHLSPLGSPMIAIFWKNLASAVGLRMHRTLAALVAIVIMAFLFAGAAGEQGIMMIGAVAGSLAIFLTFLGPVIFRDDLRDDLPQIGLLKSYPVPGWALILGEVLAPWSMLVFLEWVLVLVAAFTLHDIEEVPLTYSGRLALGMAAIVLFPCLTLVGILFQNAAALLLPGWVQLGNSQQRGIEAMGQRLTSSAATLLSLLIAAIPASVCFYGIFAYGYKTVGMAAIPAGAIAAGAILLLEAGLGIWALGRLFDRFDAATELDSDV
jgi:ABC-2 type transport system permease protein